MKEVIIIVGLLYTATSDAVMGRALLTMYSPIIVPGVYYGVQAYIDREACKAKFKHVNGNSSHSEQVEREVELLNALNPARDFSNGFFKGLVPGINFATLRGTRRDITEFNANEKVGFFSGLSMWGTMLGVLSVIKKLK